VGDGDESAHPHHICGQYRASPKNSSPNVQIDNAM
jgi:hypothetical protein